MMKYNKLIRDKIPEVIRAKGGLHTAHTADDEEYWLKLKEKLIEEVHEFMKDENIEEIADILEVIDAIADYKGFDRQEIHLVKQKKAQERGGFKDRIILEEA